MNASDKPDGYCSGYSGVLLRAVPATALRLLEVGCADGTLGAALKRLDPRRQVFGIEREPAAARRAAQRLDQVFTLDIEHEEAPIQPGSLDCILYSDVLEQVEDAEAVLRRQRRLLGPGGLALCSVANVQHHSILTALLQGDFPCTTAGVLDATHLPLFTYSTVIKLLLDAGYAPSFVEDIVVPAPAGLLGLLEPVLRQLGLHAGRTQRYLNAYQYVIRGTPLDWEAAAPNAGVGEEEPISFVVCVSDEARLRANLLSSPCFRRGSPHEVLLFRGCRNAADGLNEGLRRARHTIVICVHQDVYLPRDWPSRFLEQYRLAEAMFGTVGVAGVYGTSRASSGTLRAGCVVDRDRLLAEKVPLPALVETLDEQLLALPRGSGSEFDPRLGFHLYGADICLAAKRRGLPSVALDALCFHNSLGVGLPNSFLASAAVFRAKWTQQLPVVTPCVVIGAGGELQAS
jgi:SAM-dependent methyltransferase